MADNNFKISVIIPVYNVEKYLNRCLKTVVEQTLKEIEIILIDDGSNDSSLKICQQYKNNDSRIKIFSKKNEGLGLTRNYGINKASGEYIAFLDSDDYIELDFYEKLYKNIKKNNTDAVFGNIKLCTKNGQIRQNDVIPFKNKIVTAKKYIYNLLHVPDKLEYGKKYMGMCVWRALYKRKIIEKNQIKFESERKYISEDILFNIDFCMASNKISFVENAYYYYCYNNGSLTKTYRTDRFEKDIILYKEIIRRLKKYNQYEYVKRGIDSLFLEYVRGVIKQEICYSNNNTTIIDKKLTEIFNNEYVIKANKNAYFENLHKAIINKLIQFKCKKILKLVYRIKAKKAKQ